MTGFIQLFYGYTLFILLIKHNILTSIYELFMIGNAAKHQNLEEKEELKVEMRFFIL